jgi:hypothetical protein
VGERLNKGDRAEWKLVGSGSRRGTERRRRPYQWAAQLVYYGLAARTFAHLARCAAAIFLRSDADMVRLAEAETVVFAAPLAGCDLFRVFAHRFFCARLIRLRADADNVRRPFEFELPKAASAAVNRWTSCRALLSSFFKYPTTPDIFPIGSSSAGDCNLWAAISLCLASLSDVVSPHLTENRA